jgi:hypothetical protein
LLKIVFDAVWIIRSSQTESLCHAFYMSIDHDTRLAKGVSEYYIRRFSPDARQGDQRSHCVRNLSAKALGHGFAAGNKMSGFVLEETGGTNELFKFRKIGRSEVCRLPISPKECWSNQVDSLIGTLGGEDRGDQQFPRAMMVEFRLWIWHRALKRLRNPLKTFSMIQ